MNPTRSSAVLQTAANITKENTKHSVRSIALISAFLLLAFLNTTRADFTRSFMTMQIRINADGSADVTNELRFFMNTSNSIDLYSFSIKTTNDLSGWRDRLGLSDIRFYTDTEQAPVENVSVQASQPDTCNSDKTACYGTLTYQYHIKSPTNVSGFVNITKYVRPRVISYSLNPKALAFDVSPLGQQYISDFTSVVIILPSDSVNVVISPQPVEYTDTIPRGATKFTWQGSLSLQGMHLNFERKESLTDEVANFFNDVTTAVLSWITSVEGISLSVVAILMIIAYLLLERKKVY